MSVDDFADRARDTVEEQGGVDGFDDEEERFWAIARGEDGEDDKAHEIIDLGGDDGLNGSEELEEEYGSRVDEQ